MALTCVPQIVLHVSCRTRTSGGYFRPSEVRFRAKIPLSSHWFYNVKTQKTHFLKILEWADFDLLESNCRHIFLHKNQKIYHSGFFFSWYIFWSHVLACGDANSKLVEVVTVADVDSEDHVGNSLLQIWELTFGPKSKLLFRLWAQGLVMILKSKFRQDFVAGVCSAFCRWCFVEVMKLNLGRYSEARLGQDFEF